MTGVILRGGTPVGAGAGSGGDVVVSAGRIAEAPAAFDEFRVIDTAGAIVVPGLVDLHGHVDTTGFDAAVPADEAHLRRGVVAVNDGGSVGARGFDAFLSGVVRASRCRVTAFLNAGADGIRFVLQGEYADRSVLRVAAAVAVATQHPDVVRGVKVRLGRLSAGDDPLPILDAGLRIAAEAGLPLMVHVGDTACTLAEILAGLRPGDIVTHCFHGKREGILEGGVPSPAVLDARAAGVLFDIGHGATQLSYAVAEAAIGSGFLPDTISSDLTRTNWNGPAFDLVTVMSKLIALGMPLTEAITATSTIPSRILGLDGYGTLTVGEPAHLVVLRQRAEAEELPDGAGHPLTLRRYEPELVVDGVDVLPSARRRDEIPGLHDTWTPTPPPADGADSRDQERGTA